MTQRLRGDEGIPRAQRRLRLAIEAVSRRQGAFGDFMIYTTGLPMHDSAPHGFVGERVGEVRAISVSGVDLSAGHVGVHIVTASFLPDEPGEPLDKPDQPIVHDVTIDGHNGLVFLRDALSRLIEARVLVIDKGERVAENADRAERAKRLGEA
jgi:hypothetical protein